MKIRDYYNAYQYAVACLMLGMQQEAIATLQWLGQHQEVKRGEVPAR